MKIGIIVYSHTGNTLSVAESLKERLIAQGHAAEIQQVVPTQEKPGVNGKIQLKTNPDPSGYDTLVFASPVQAFSLAAVMKAYVKEIPQLDGKRAACFVTQQLPKPWLGGNRAIAAMTDVIKARGLEVCCTGIIHWSSKRRQQMIDDLLANICGLWGNLK